MGHERPQVRLASVRPLGLCTGPVGGAGRGYVLLLRGQDGQAMEAVRGGRHKRGTCTVLISLSTFSTFTHIFLPSYHHHHRNPPRSTPGYTPKASPQSTTTGATPASPPPPTPASSSGTTPVPAPSNPSPGAATPFPACATTPQNTLSWPAPGLIEL